MDRVCSLELVFENLESIIVPIEMVSKFEYGKLSEQQSEYLKNAYISEGTEIHITYKNDSDLVYNPDRESAEVLGTYIDNQVINHVKDRPNVLGRVLNYQDLVYLDLLDENEHKIKSIYVPWHEKDEENNRFQFVEAANGVLMIVIKAEHK